MCVSVCIPACLITDILSQLVLEAEEKEAILRKMSKQSKTMNKMKRGESSLHQRVDKLLFYYESVIFSPDNQLFHLKKKRPHNPKVTFFFVCIPFFVQPTDI